METHVRARARASGGDASNGRDGRDNLSTGVGGNNNGKERPHGATTDVVTLSLIASGTARVELTLLERSATKVGPYPLKT